MDLICGDTGETSFSRPKLALPLKELKSPVVPKSPSAATRRARDLVSLALSLSHSFVFSICLPLLPSTHPPSPASVIHPPIHPLHFCQVTSTCQTHGVSSRKAQQHKLVYFKEVQAPAWSPPRFPESEGPLWSPGGCSLNRGPSSMLSGGGQRVVPYDQSLLAVARRV